MRGRGTQQSVRGRLLGTGAEKCEDDISWLLNQFLSLPLLSNRGWLVLVFNSFPFNVVSSCHIHVDFSFLGFYKSMMCLDCVVTTRKKVGAQEETLDSLYYR